MMSYHIAVIASLVWQIAAEYADKPCAARAVANRSVLCVCTTDYCDTVIRETPTTASYYTYVSSEAGLRFKKSSGELQSAADGSVSNNSLEIDPSTTYQTIEGFGGAVTDAASITWKNLTDATLMQHLIDSYCGDSGIQYNLLRVPIGGADFSTRPYAYNELPENDITLSNFTLAPEDYDYKIPMIQACQKVSSARIDVIGSTWSPPPWMKTNNNFTGYSRLKKEYLQAYADYHYKFIEHYAAAGVPVWGITTTNEPLDATLDYININNLGWTIDYMGEWIANNLGPTLRNSTFKDVKIIAGDDQSYTVPLYWNSLVSRYPDTLPYLDGVAVHFYMNQYVPLSLLTQSMVEYPDKFVISTEACAGAQVTDTISVDLGSWPRAELYFNDIIQNLKNNVIGWIDWNMALNTEGGPNWLKSSVDAPVIINAEAGEFYKQPMFYAMGHFSKFVPRNSKRIKMNETTNTNIQTLAFLTPENTIVVVIYNSGASDTVKIRLGGKEAALSIEAKSFTTFEMLKE
ncbi:lysosomal acid glucosylceramidase-like [Anticarsia gemmatalis]|uniref:lysosomal acid glucosylceramidase-like n=1 Tax=Anticarsia gemmatalis TaxID=129554 RepID=UPI003F75AB87